MLTPELNSLVIVAELARASLGGSSAAITNRANDNLQGLALRNTVTLSAEALTGLQSQESSLPSLRPDYAPDSLLSSLDSQPQEQGLFVDCPWVVPEGSQATEYPPQVQCEVIQDPSGGLPRLKVYLPNLPQDKASMVSFALLNSDAVIVAANPNDVTVNLQSVCAIGMNQFWGRSMLGPIWETGDFITDEKASAACFDGISTTTTITMVDQYGVQKQFLFDPRESGLNGNIGIFRPFIRNPEDSSQIFFNPANPDTARTLNQLQDALQEQLEIATGQLVYVWPTFGYLDATKILEQVPAPTPIPTAIPTFTPEPALPPVEAAAAQAQAVNIMASPRAELINNPNVNIGFELYAATGKVQIYRQNPTGTDPQEIANQISMLNQTYDQKLIDEQFGNTISHTSFGEWIKDVFGLYEPAVRAVDNQPINMTKVLRINFGRANDRRLTIDGLDQVGQYVRIYLPVNGDAATSPDGTMAFENGTSFKFTALDSAGAPDEASETLRRLTEQLNHYYRLGAQFETMPEVVVVPMPLVPYLYADTYNRDNMIYAAQQYAQTQASVEVTFSYLDPSGNRQLVPQFQLPTGMVGTAKQLFILNGIPMYEVEVPLMGEALGSNTVSDADLSQIYAQIPAGVNIANSFTIYVPADQIAALPGEKINPPVQATPQP